MRCGWVCSSPGLSYLAVGRDRLYQVAVALGLFGVLAYMISLSGTLNVVSRLQP